MRPDPKYQQLVSTISCVTSTRGGVIGCHVLHLLQRDAEQGLEQAADVAQAGGQVYMVLIALQAVCTGLLHLQEHIK
jgi:hypothetical protein